MWPEYQSWCRRHSRPGDHWWLPLDGHRWKKPNYAWTPPAPARVHTATWQTLRGAFRNRRLALQGAARQRALLSRSARLAAHYARHLDPRARHLVVAQDLLATLWQQGALGGRTFDVLITRWPIGALQQRLDEAARLHPASVTLADFRADPGVVRAETEALAAAARIVTPHRAIAAHFGSRALLLDWQFPEPEAFHPARARRRFFLPASPLGRKGVYELAAALKCLDAELLVLGEAREDAPDPLAGLAARRATAADLLTAAAVVLPAWIEHESRLALRALANGIPVVATAACGLPAHPLLWQLAEPHAEALHAILLALLSAEAGVPTQCAFLPP